VQRAALAFSILMITSLAVQAAEPSVAVVEVTPAPDPSWREQDLKILESLRSALQARPGQSSLPGSQVSKVFEEPPDTASGPLAARASQRLKKGQEYYARLKPKRAIKEFSAALRILRAIFPSLPGLSELEQAHLMLGMTYQALGKAKRAAREYGMVLLLNPQRKLDENTVNPMVVERFSKVRERLMTSMKGSISLISKPAGARVLMNGRAVGYSPVTIPGVYPGEHYFSMVLDGYKTWFGVLRLKPGGLQKREVFLQDGQRISWVHLRNRMAQAGIGKTRIDDASKLTGELKTDWLLLVSISHLGGSTMMELGIYESGSAEVSPLGIFAADAGKLGIAADRVARWIGGDRTVPEEKTFVRVIKHPDIIGGGTGHPPPPPPPNGSTAWYKSWWFWTTVGVVAAGATAGTILLLQRDSGIQVQAYR